MASALTWLDYDAVARERSLRILALFREHEARDELGVGSIAGAFSDLLFPGTSTIQTRLAYMLFVPWLYQDLENKRVSSASIRARTERAEAELVEPLLAMDGEKGQEVYGGVIGRVARNTLKRFPSSIYWAGLARWGIRTYRGSQDQYFRDLDRIYVARAQRRRRDDQEWADQDHTRTWHAKLPVPPDGFPQNATFALRAVDAAFLRDRILMACKGSLLAWLVEHPPEVDADFPWELDTAQTAPPPVRHELEHAKRFSIVMHGAALLYNLQLAELVANDELKSQYRKQLGRWASATDWAVLAGWQLADFFDTARTTDHTISLLAEGFVRAWLSVSIRLRGVVADSRDARDLVKHREQSLKRTRSRFTNRAALGQWSGASGTARLTYRWPTAHTFLKDLVGATRGGHAA